MAFTELAEPGSEGLHKQQWFSYVSHSNLIAIHPFLGACLDCIAGHPAHQCCSGCPDDGDTGEADVIGPRIAACTAVCSNHCARVGAVGCALYSGIQAHACNSMQEKATFWVVSQPSLAFPCPVTVTLQATMVQLAIALISAQI